MFSETTQVNEVYETIEKLFLENLGSFEKGSKPYEKLNQSFKKFQEKAEVLKGGKICDENFIFCLNEALQSFLLEGGGEISSKARQGRSGNAADYEKLLKVFGLTDEIPLSDFEGKTIVILGSDYGGMRNMAKWFCGHSKTGLDQKGPEVLFLTGHRPAFSHIKEERDFLAEHIKAKVGELIDPESVIKLAENQALERAEQSHVSKKDKEVIKQALIPLFIMSEVNKLAPRSYQFEGLDDFGQAKQNPTDLLKLALINKIYPSEIDFVDKVASEFFGDRAKMVFNNDMGRIYRATTVDNASALQKFLESEGRVTDAKIALISQQPFCGRQLADLRAHFEVEGVKGVSFECAGPGMSEQMKGMINSASVLDVFARFVYASNLLIEKRKELSERVLMGKEDLRPLSGEPLSAVSRQVAGRG